MDHASPMVTTCYAAQPGAVAVAREAMADLARDCGAGDEQVEQVRLAVSEAVTNAVLHGYPGSAGEVRVGATRTAGQLTISVCDDGVGVHGDAARPGLGLGLGIVDRMSDRMTLLDRPGGGTELRMGFALRAGAAAGPRCRDVRAAAAQPLAAA